MATAPTPDHPSHVFVDTAFLAARYGRKRTFVSELVRSPGFPRPVVAGRWRQEPAEARGPGRQAAGRRAPG